MDTRAPYGLVAVAAPPRGVTALRALLSTLPADFRAEARTFLKESDMTTMMPVSSTDATVGAVLAARHEDWMQHVAAVLTPALDERADFWSRWAISRYLDDRFGDRFRLECALVDALGPWLPAEATRLLAAARQSIERTGEELMAAGRRRESRSLTARLARRFVDQLALWCVEVERATDGIPTDGLPVEVQRLLRRLPVADALGRR